MKLLAVGSNTVRNTFAFPYPQWEVKEVLWRSPFTLIDLRSEEGKDFNRIFQTYEADYFVLDLYALTSYLVCKDGAYYSKDNRYGVKEDLHCPFENESLVCNILDHFAHIIKTKYPAQKIILLCTKKASKYKKGNLVRACEEDKKSNSLLKKYEDYFVAATGCRTIDILDDYFMDPYYRFGESAVNYEEFAYDDMRARLHAMITQKDPPSTFPIKIKRYLEYGDFLDRSFKLSWLFDPNNIVEDFIASLSVPLAKQYENELLCLNTSIASLDELLDCVKETRSTALVEAALWYVACKNNRFAKLPYTGVIKEYKTAIAKTVIRFLNYQIQEHHIAGHTVTMQNLEYYIPYLIDNKFKSLAARKDIPQPITLDIWGSCISREIFAALNTDAALNHYTFRSSPLHLQEPPVNEVKTIFDDLTLFNGSQWRSGFLKHNLLRQTSDIIQKSHATWLLLDLYDLSELTYQIHEKPFVLDYDSTKLPFYTLLCKEFGCKAVGFRPYSEEELEKRLRGFADLLKEKYGDHIILTNITFHNSFLTDNGAIRSLNRDAKEMYEKNLYLRKCQCLLEEMLDCYVLDISDKCLADERFVWGESPVHYEAFFFRFAADCVDRILAGKQKEKHISHIPLSYRAERLARIRKNKNCTLETCCAIISYPLDRYLLPLDQTLVESHTDYLDSLMQSLSPTADAVEFIAHIDENQHELREQCISKLL